MPVQPDFQGAWCALLLDRTGALLRRQGGRETRCGREERGAVQHERGFFFGLPNGVESRNASVS